MSKQTITLATGETVQIGVGDGVYLDLGDGINGGEISGEVSAIDSTHLQVGQEKVAIGRIIYLDIY